MSGLVERVIRASMARRPLVLAAAAAVALLGLLCLLRLPVDALPDLSENQVLVLAEWPGHSSREVERQVTLPLSAQLGGLPELKVVRTTSELGFALVSLIFEDHADFHWMRTRVAERLAAAGAGLPPGVVPSLAPDATALGQVFWYTLEGGGLDPGELRALQDTVVKPRLAAVHGVAEVASVGGAVRELQVEVDPLRLRALGVSLEEVLAAAGRGSGASGGQALTTASVEYAVAGLTAARAADEVGAAVVAARPRGAVRVRDVARVHLGPAPRRALLEKDGGEAVGGMVLMRHRENPRALIERLKGQLEAVQAALPHGVRVVPFYDRTRLVDGALDTLRRVLLEEVVVVLLMVLLVLRHLRSALVVVLTLPVAVLAAFALMAALDIPSNIMSLAGIAVAIGVLADSALVMTENAYTRLREAGPERREAVALEACLAVGRPLFFSVLITVVSFLPVFALSGMEGRLFWPLAVTKTFALLAVAVLAVTLVPALVPLLVRGRLRAEGEVWLVRSLQAVYRPVLAFLLPRPWWVAASFALLAFTGAAVAPRLGSEFMPALDEGVLLDMPVTAPGVTLEEAGRSLAARDAVLRSLPEVEVVVGKAGRAETATDPAPLEMIETVVGLRPRGEWPARALPAGVFLEGARASLGPRADRAREVGQAAQALFDRRMRAHLEAAPGRDLEPLADAELRQALVDAATGQGLTASPPAALSHPYLRAKHREELVEELDGLLQQPGWSNVWTQPIINRVEMLATGIRTQVGVKVLGEDLAALQAVALQVAQVLRSVPGAVDVFADQALAQPTLEVALDRERAALAGVDPEAVDTAVETALGGRVVGAALEGRRRLPVRVRYAPDFRSDLERVGAVLVGQPPVPLSRVATVQVVEGPGMIRGEHGLLAATVQLNVRGRDLGGFVEEAQRAVAARVRLPEKVSLEWGGQYQHQLSARRTLQVVVPVVLALILLILYLTWRDLGDALVLLLSVPGALVGGLVLQWLAGVPFSVAVWVGYIACFGLATETGIIVLTYMREAIERRGGLAAIGSEAELEEAVLAGAVQRLRPKLLTEGVIVLSLLPMAWATGVGAELLRPMALPVLGGVLVADEVVDLAIPALFFWLRRARWRALRQAPGTPATPAPVAAGG